MTGVDDYNVPAETRSDNLVYFHEGVVVAGQLLVYCFSETILGGGNLVDFVLVDFVFKPSA